MAQRDVGVLVLPARMDERLLEEVEVPDRQPEPRRERLGRTHDPGGAADVRMSG